MSTPLAIRLIAWAWLISALLLGRTQALGRLPGPATLGLTLLLTSGLWTAYARAANFRTWINALDLRSLVLLHSTRLVGYIFYSSVIAVNCRMLSPSPAAGVKCSSPRWWYPYVFCP